MADWRLTFLLTIRHRLADRAAVTGSGDRPLPLCRCRRRGAARRLLMGSRAILSGRRKFCAILLSNRLADGAGFPMREVTPPAVS